jgi:hypothetical protein
MVAEPKTRLTGASVADFLATVAPAHRQSDAYALLAMLEGLSGCPATMWGPSIVGFCAYHSPSGEWPIIAFSPRKPKMVLYVMPGFTEFQDHLARLGPHSTGASCLYFNRLDNLDRGTLESLCKASIDHMRRKHLAGQPTFRNLAG